MELVAKRRWLTKQSSISEVFVDGVAECFWLEDRTRLKCTHCGVDVVDCTDAKCPLCSTGHQWVQQEKVQKETAIPLGRYKLVKDFSERFQVVMMHILDVPNFQGIRVHPGNKPVDTEGCPLPGRQRGDDVVLESRVAWEALDAKVSAALSRGEDVWVTVVLASEAERASC